MVAGHTPIAEETDMKLIGAGLPRTGTLSQKVALEMVGLGPCYHMVNVLSDLSLVEVWRQVYSGELRVSEALAGFPSSVDWPGSFYYEQLMEAHPEAKVLLSVRDGEAWELSMRQTIYDVLYGDSLVNDLARARARVDTEWRAYNELMQGMWSDIGLTEGPAPGSLAGIMERYNERVRATVPHERLLEWSPRDGWEPLCAFLEIPVPEAPFPRLNDGQFFTTQMIDGSLAALRQWREADPALPARSAAAPA
jgi:hypothetical protein